MINILKPSTNI